MLLIAESNELCDEPELMQEGTDIGMYVNVCDCLLWEKLAQCNTMWYSQVIKQCVIIVYHCQVDAALRLFAINIIVTGISMCNQMCNQMVTSEIRK